MPSSCICMHSFCIRVCSLQCEMRLSLCNPTDIFFRTSSYSGQLGIRKLQKKERYASERGFVIFLAITIYLKNPPTSTLSFSSIQGIISKYTASFKDSRDRESEYRHFTPFGALSERPFSRCLLSPMVMLRMLKNTSTVCFLDGWP